MVAILFAILILNMSKVKGGKFAIRGQLMIPCYLIYIYISLYSYAGSMGLNVVRDGTNINPKLFAGTSRATSQFTGHCIGRRLEF